MSDVVRRPLNPKLWLRFAEAMERRLLASSDKASTRERQAYFSKRDMNPVIQWQWDALTEVTPASKGGGAGTIHFPNGNNQAFTV